MSVVARFGAVQKATVAEYTVLIDDLADEEFLVGRAVVGSGTGDAVWQIYKAIESGDDIAFYYADGSDNYNKVWDDRASYTYD